MENLFSLETIVALLTLTSLEIVLGIDNVVFISILVGKLPQESRAWVRTVGLGLALVTRLMLLFTLKWIMGLSTVLFTVFGHAVSGRDLILLTGGLFLIGKSTYELHDKLEGDEQHEPMGGRAAVGSLLLQIALLDIIFSLDSVITAVGMARELWVMSAAVVIAVVVMMFAAGAIGDFVDRHPTMKVLALSFLILIGVLLLAEGAGAHLNRGYVYFAMAFSFVVELINMRVRRSVPLKLKQTHVEESLVP
jgi:predicted tellurium resistance membrane protein TerC